MPTPPIHPLQPLAERRLRRVRVVCSVLAGTVVLLGALSWVLAGEMPIGLRETMGQLPIVLTILAAILFLLSSRLRASILRRATGGRLQPDPETVLATYAHATLLSFAALEGAALLGPAVAFLSGEPRYGLVVCAAALLAMATRWPRSAEALRLPGLRQVPDPPVPPRSE
jgi:hypothetical protein